MPGAEKRRLLLLSAILIIISLACLSSLTGQVWADDNVPSSDLEKVRLQLKWKHQFQFAGYYAAVEQGYYREAGLDVELLVRTKDPKRPTDIVLEGQADYGIEGTHLLTSRINGQPLVALAAIFQHSPAVAISLQKNSLETAKDMSGRRIMSYGGTDIELSAMLLQEAIPEKSIDWQPMSFNLDSLINGETDFYSSYLINEPFFLEQRNIPYSIINPIKYGIDFYADMLFTTEHELAEHPQRAKAFREASLRGWKYALENPEEIVDLILRKYRKDKSREHLLFEARESIKLIRSDVVEVGHMNPGRIEHMADVLLRLGRVEHTDGLSRFIYAENTATNLSEKERSWLAENHQVRVFVAHAPPLIFVEDDRVEGLVIDYLNLLTEEYGIQLEFSPSAWNEAVTGVVGQKGPDVLPIISPSPLRHSQMVLSDSFLLMPSVIFTRDDGEYIGGIEDLSGLKVAMPKGFLLQDLFEKNHPGINRVLTPSLQEALELLATGEADAYIGSLMLTSHIIKEMGLENIKVAAPFTLLPPEHALAARKDWPELISLFNRILRDMTPQEHAKIRQRWLSMRYEYGVSRDELWVWVGSGLAIFIGCFGVFTAWSRRLQREIKRRNNTEDALINSIQQYQALVQVIPHGIIEISETMEISYCNNSLSDLLGYKFSDLLGMSIEILIADDASLAAFRQILQEPQPDKKHQGLQLRLMDTQERTHDVQFDIDFTDRGVSEHQIIIVTDLTRQENAERALQESEAFYRTTFDNIQAGVVHLTTDGQIIRANRYMQEMLGYPESELSRMDLIQITHPEDVEVSKAMLSQLLQGDTNSYSLAKRYLKKDGSPVWGLVSVSLQPQAKGEQGYVVVVQDIDSFKQQQDEVTETAHNLETIIASRTEELQKRVDEVEKLNFAMMNLADDLQRSNSDLALQQEQLAEANADLESFAYSVSHDLRAPLRHVSGFVAILQESSVSKLDTADLRHLEKIEKSAKRMGEMIDDLLAFSRAGSSDLISAPIDMNLLFKESFSTVCSDYPTLNIEWQVDDLPQIKGDVSSLRLVVINLLDNAVKYSSNNEQSFVRVEAHRNSDEVVFEVRDNGVGFDPAYEEKLFKVFQRLHREDEFGGTGIGLASVRRIVLRHGGWVKGESLPGQGACFSFALPSSVTEDQFGSSEV